MAVHVSHKIGELSVLPPKLVVCGNGEKKMTKRKAKRKAKKRFRVE